MNTIQTLEQRAVTTAKKESWGEAITINQEILDKNPQNIGALSRIAMAYLRLGKTGKAKEHYEKVLELDKANTIALKQLANIKKKITNFPQFSAQNFIQEPGIAKVISLHRLAGKNILEHLVVGQNLALKPKNRYISIETIEKTYIGSLPEDISMRLTALINTDNQYLCQVHSASYNHCDVFIKETFRSPKNQNRHSFPVILQTTEVDDLGEDILLENDVPLNLTAIDDDHEHSMEDISSANNEETGRDGE